MPQVGRDVVKDRARRLRTKGEAALRQHLDRQVGATRRVLAETSALGRTEQFAQVRLRTPLEAGVLADLPIIGHDGRRLIAA
jgi:threonylcarbamoyladenosine tRNA methylthiotransferase MtaB